MSNPLSPDRPWEDEKLNPGPVDSSDVVPKKFFETTLGRVLFWGGGLIVICVFAVQFVNSRDDPCRKAEEAYMLSTSLDTQDGRVIAGMQYEDLSAECTAKGGTVRR